MSRIVQPPPRKRRRPWRCAGSRSGSRASSPTTGSTSRRPSARCTRCSARTAPGRARSRTSSPASTTRTPASCTSAANPLPSALRGMRSTSASAWCTSTSASSDRKRFPGVVANDGVDFEAAVGEVHALLGENGAGKSTLSNILTGLYHPDAGELHVRGQPVAFGSPRDALDVGIGMVHQHFRLVEPFTVAENVVLGDHRDVGRSFLLHRAEIEQRVAELAKRYGLAVDPRARIWQLSVGEQQRVEILKALYRDATILILDEPTAVLTPQEAEALFQTLRAMAAEERTVIFISHKLHEVMAVADRITVLRDGRSIATVRVSDVTRHELAALMVGRDVEVARRREPASIGDVVLEVRGLSVRGDRGVEALRDVTVTVR